MQKGVLAGAAAVLVGALLSACGSVEQHAGGRGKLSASELEAFLREAAPGGPTYHCKPATRNRWDYVCSFTDDAGTRMNIDVMVNDEQATRSSGAYPADPAMAPQTGAPAPARSSWLVKVDRLCGWARSEAAQVAKPRTFGEFEQYFLALREINERYRVKLAALPTAPTLADRATFRTLLLHLKEDQRLAAELLQAIRAGDRPAAAEFFGRLQLQAAEENRLLGAPGRLSSRLNER